jgi:hypothetical protein
MKNYKLPFLGFALVLLIASCRKEDIQANNTTNNLSAVSNTAQWKSLSNWSSSKNEEITTYFSKVSDSSITSNVVNAGFVLVFKKNGSDIQSLPFQEKSSKTYWYYQVSGGSLRINSDNNGGQNLNAQSFAYFVISPEKLSALEASGKAKLDLLQLSFEQAEALLK